MRRKKPMNAKRIAVGAACGLSVLAAVLLGYHLVTGGPAPLAAAEMPTGEHAGHAHGSEPPDEHAGEGHDEGHEEGARAEAEHAAEAADAHDHAEEAADDHAAHEAAGHTETDDPHAGHDHGAEPAVHLTAEERDRAGIELAAAERGTLSLSLHVPGEVVLNADRMAHIVPRAPGIVREVTKSVGDTVDEGEILAVLESAELGEAKVAYLAAYNELFCCGMDLDRARAVHDNTLAFLEFLDTSPDLEALRKRPATEMGENRSRLVAAYAERVFARAAYEREKELVDENVSSRRDLQAATSAYKKAYADYLATRDSIAFQVKRTLSEEKRKRRSQEFAVKAAERKLRLYGLTPDDIQALRDAAQSADPLLVPECNDPNCTDCKAGKGQGDGAAGTLGGDLGVYALRAPFSGTVIEKHIARGEKLGDDADAFTVADLGTVWVNLSAYQKDLPYLDKGRKVVLSAGGTIGDATAPIAFVAPIVDERTRTALVRMVLPNPDGRWRPGLFVRGTVEVDKSAAGVLVPREAVQRVHGKDAVFVPAAEGFEPKPVTVGRSSRTRVEVLSGLNAGDRYVARGAFELKAKLVTSGFGAHAGHGH
jgi:cobalt-zinc-cadmium efflux system membrane fusion protein